MCPAVPVRLVTYVPDLNPLAKDLYERGEVDLSKAYVDGSHAGAKKGALLLGNSRRQSDQDRDDRS